MDVKRNKLVVSSCAFLMISGAGYATKMNFSVSGGPNFSTLKNERLVPINNVITNAYQTKEKTNWHGFWAVGINHTFEKAWFSFYQLSLGASGYFFHLGDVNGTEFPFINEGLFDTLHYKFSTKSATVMAEAKIAYSQYDLKPYVLAGIGSAWNRFYNYDERPTDPSLSAAPATGFTDHTKQTFTYELGAGLQYLLWNDKAHDVQYTTSLGYQYFNLGNGALGNSDAQTSAGRLKIKNLYTQAIVASLAVSFG